jgi:hypothetical protein
MENITGKPGVIAEESRRRQTSREILWFEHNRRDLFKRFCSGLITNFVWFGEYDAIFDYFLEEKSIYDKSKSLLVVGISNATKTTIFRLMFSFIETYRKYMVHETDKNRDKYLKRVIPIRKIQDEYEKKGFEAFKMIEIPNDIMLDDVGLEQYRCGHFDSKINVFEEIILRRENAFPGFKTHITSNMPFMRNDNTSASATTFDDRYDIRVINRLKRLHNVVALVKNIDDFRK